MPSATAASATTASRQGLVSVDGKTFPLRAARLEARASLGLAWSTLTQEYENPWAEPLEVLYTLPLPADGAVLGYDIRLGERTITGVVESRDQARKKYDEALLAGHTAGLLEEERADTFTLSLGNLPGKASARVEVRVMHRLAFQPGATNIGAQWEYRFPTVVGVRYHGAPGRVPDAGALDPERADEGGTPARLDLDLVIADGDGGLAPTSPSHELILRETEGVCRVALANPERLDRDVVVRWRAASAEIGARLVEGPGLPGDPGRYGLLTLTPPAVPRATFARDLTILIDASGSMSGPPIEQAKEIAIALLRSLSSSDRFEVLAFANSVTALTRGIVAATPKAVDRAAAELRSLRARGGTEMASAVTEALEPLRRDSQRQVVLITDGQIGFEGEIVGRVLRELPAGARLHVAGVGMAPNRTLTHAASRAGRGVEVIVGTREDASASAETLCRATAAPVLTNVLVSGSAVAAVAQEKPVDVFAGRPALLALELRPEGGTIEVRGDVADRGGTWSEEITVGPLPTEAVEGPALGALFGRERVEDCEMLLAGESRGSKHTWLETIESLGLRHRIATRRTSLVAISENPTVDPSDPRRRERLAVEMPLDLSAEGVGFASPIAARPLHAQALWRRAYETFGLIGVSDSAGVEISEAGAAPVVARGRILRHEADVLVIELDVPPEGFCVPADGARLVLTAGGKVKATVIGDLGTRAGSYAAGLTVRLALRLDRPLSLSGVESLVLSGPDQLLEIDLR
jgi:Ca-activated chloride channel family protein